MATDTKLLYLKDFTNEERSLLLFFETACVDHGGFLASVHMNKDDFVIAKQWNESGFAPFKRMKISDIRKQTAQYPHTHQVDLGATAWSLAQEERRNRAARIRKTYAERDDS